MKCYLGRGYAFKLRDKEWLLLKQTPYKNLEELDDLFNQACLQEDLEAMEYFLFKGADINSYSGYALNLCVSYNLFTSVEFLLSKGVYTHIDNGYVGRYLINLDRGLVCSSYLFSCYYDI